MLEFFHIDHESPYAEKSLLKAGDVIDTSSRRCNPFYKRALALEYSIQMDTARWRLLAFLDVVKSWEEVPKRLPGDMHTVLEGYVKLVREMEFENVRRESFGYRPSRTRCIWLAEDYQSALSWFTRLEGRQNARIVRVLVDGKPFATNEAYLQQDAHSIEETREFALQYWNGIPHPTGRTELLFEGRAEVAEVC